MEKLHYKIGEKTWFKGDEVTVTTEPYVLNNHQWQDAVNGKGDTVTLATPLQKRVNLNNAQMIYSQSQIAFSNLNKSNA